MTQVQVVVSLGYPPAHETPSLEAERWKDWYGNFDTFLVIWDDQLRVREALADPQTRAAVVASDQRGCRAPRQHGIVQAAQR